MTMDGDLQDIPEEIPKFLKVSGRADMVVGWRHKRKDKIMKRIISAIFNNLFHNWLKKLELSFY